MFEDSVCDLADRVANVTVLSESLLTTLTAADIRFPNIDTCELDELKAKPHKLRVACRDCEKRIRIAAESLRGSVRCRACQIVQPADWAEVC